MKRKVLSKILHESIKKVLCESDEELTDYDEYVNDYPNDNFSKNDVDIVELLSFIQNSGDFLYYYLGRFHAANTQALVDDIYNDVQQNGATLTNKLDSDLDWNWNKFFGNSDLYVAVFETLDESGKKYQIIYEREKLREPYSSI